MPASERGTPLAGRTDARPTCGNAFGMYTCSLDAGHEPADQHAMNLGRGMTAEWSDRDACDAEQPPAPPSGADATPDEPLGFALGPDPEAEGDADLSDEAIGALFAEMDAEQSPSAPAALPPIPEGHPHAKVLRWIADHAELTSHARWADELRASYAALLALPGDARPEGDARAKGGSVWDGRKLGAETDVLIADAYREVGEAVAFCDAENLPLTAWAGRWHAGTVYALASALADARAAVEAERNRAEAYKKQRDRVRRLYYIGQGLTDEGAADEVARRAAEDDATLLAEVSRDR